MTALGDWIGQSQPRATTAYANQAVADKRGIIEIIFDLHHKLHNK